MSTSRSRLLLATADDFGTVKLFKYPAVVKGMQSLVYGGHSSHVTNVRWSLGDECLLSTGGNDRSVLQWRCVIFEQDHAVSTGVGSTTTTSGVASHGSAMSRPSSTNGQVQGAIVQSMLQSVDRVRDGMAIGFRELEILRTLDGVGQAASGVQVRTVSTQLCGGAVCLVPRGAMR